MTSDLRNFEDQSILGTEIRLDLYRWDGKTSLTKGANGEITSLSGQTPVDSCQVISDGSKRPHCTFTLPGTFSIITCTQQKKLESLC